MPTFLHAKMEPDGSETLAGAGAVIVMPVATRAWVCERLGSGRVSRYIRRCALGQYRGLDRDKNCGVIGIEWNG